MTLHEVVGLSAECDQCGWEEGLLHIWDIESAMESVVTRGWFLRPEGQEIGLICPDCVRINAKEVMREKELRHKAAMLRDREEKKDEMRLR